VGNPPQQKSADLTLARVLWGALFGSTLIYIVVLELTAARPDVDWKALAPMFAFGAAGASGASLLAPRFVARSAGGYLVTLIVALALAESVCILGLVLGFLGAPPMVVLPFFVVTWVLMIVRFPTRERLETFGA
jgi:hypothetical protein